MRHELVEWGFVPHCVMAPCPRCKGEKTRVLEMRESHFTEARVICECGLEGKRFQNQILNSSVVDSWAENPAGAAVTWWNERTK